MHFYELCATMCGGRSCWFFMWGPKCRSQRDGNGRELKEAVYLGKYTKWDMDITIEHIQRAWRAGENTLDRWGKHVNKGGDETEGARARGTQRETKTSLRHAKGEADLNKGDLTDSHGEGTAL